MAFSIDPDQTAPEGAVWSGTALFACAILSETLCYCMKFSDIYRHYMKFQKLESKGTIMVNVFSFFSKKTSGSVMDTN